MKPRKPRILPRLWRCANGCGKSIKASEAYSYGDNIGPFCSIACAKAHANAD